METATGLPVRWVGVNSNHAVDTTAAHVDNHKINQKHYAPCLHSPGSAADQLSGSDSQQCLLLHRSPCSMDPGLRQWAESKKMQGNGQRIGNCARLIWLAQQLSVTIEQETARCFRRCSMQSMLLTNTDSNQAATEEPNEPLWCA